MRSSAGNEQVHFWENLVAVTLCSAVRLHCLPVLLDVKGPLELQVLVLVVVGEHGDGFVVAAADHA